MYDASVRLRQGLKPDADRWKSNEARIGGLGYCEAQERKVLYCLSSSQLSAPSACSPWAS